VIERGRAAAAPLLLSVLSAELRMGCCLTSPRPTGRRRRGRLAHFVGPAGTKAANPGYPSNPGSAVLPDDPPSEKAVRDSVQRLRKTAARLSDRLKQSSDKIAALDDAANHPERAVRRVARQK
jgi:hypothetical protein